jgi:hypothetical protein
VHLDRVGMLLAGHPEQAVVAATTGPTNLLANVLAPTPAALHQYLTRKLADDAIIAVETTPVLRTLKAASGARTTQQSSRDLAYPRWARKGASGGVAW